MRPPGTRPSAIDALLPVLPLLGSMLSICIGTSFAKTLFPAVGATGTTALRVVISALLLVAIRRPWRWRITRPALAAVAVYGTVLGSMNLLFYMALKTLPLGIAIAIEFIGPMGVAIAGSRRAIDFLWIACAAAGLALLLPLDPHGQALDPVGIGFALAAALCWALYILCGKRVSGLIPESQAVCLGLCTAALVVLPFGVAGAGRAMLSPPVLLAGAVVAVLSSAIPYSLEMIALKRLPKQVFGVLMSLEPAAGALAAMAILGEQLSALQWLAIGAVVVASCGSTITATRLASADMPLP